MIVFGFHAVEGLLKSDYEIQGVHILQSKEKNQRLDAIRGLVRGRKLHLKEYAEKKDYQSALTRAGGKPEELDSSQGIFAVIGEFEYVEFEPLLASLAQKKRSILVFLDSVTDPQNLGSILRSAAFFGIDGLVTMDRRAAPITATALKISSGGFLYVPVAQVGNLVQALEKAKENGFWVYGMSEHAAESLGKVEFTTPVALVIGNEEKGMRPLVEKTCDQVLRLPAAGPQISLNAAVATAIALALVREQQKP